MENKKVLYTSEEILAIFQEQYRLYLSLSDIRSPDFFIERQCTIMEWRDALDIYPWYQFGAFLNAEFRIDVKLTVWKQVLTPSDDKTIGDLCDFLSTVAYKEIVAPVKRLGTDCLSAAVFFTLKKNLESRGVDVSQLKPSTPFEPFLRQNYEQLLMEITLTGVRTLDTLTFGELQTKNLLKKWVNLLLPNVFFKEPFNTGDIHTFRDLVERIMVGEVLAQSGIENSTSLN